MEQMTEEFDNRHFDTPPEKYPHLDVVRLYYLGTHSDYGCTARGVRGSRLEFFKKAGS